MDGYLDGELDPISSQKIEQHLRDCRKCEQAYEAHMALAHAVSRGAPYYKAPAELRQRVQLSLRDAIGTKAIRSGALENQRSITRPQPEPRAVLFETPWNWLGLAAAIIFAAIIFSNLASVLRRPGADQFLATQLSASHVRSLMVNHLTDVASSDQHTVKPWLDARLNFAPPVVDLTNEGFPLIGGRLDYLNHRPVAALIYHRRQHFINLFIWPAAPNESRMPKTLTRDGYQLLHWDGSPFHYWAVSDVSEADLQAFKQAFDEQISRH